MIGTHVSKIVLILLFMFGLIPATAVQGAQAESGLAGLGLPELSITLTTSAIEGIPDQVDAGRYLVVVTVDDDVEFGGGVGFIQPVGASSEDVLAELAALAGPPPEADGASPEGSPSAADVHGDHEEALPSAMFDSIYAGGTGVLSGQTGHVVVDLTPGEWIAWGEDPEAPQSPVIFQVTGDMPDNLLEPEAAATLVMGEYLIMVSEGELTAGSHVVRIDNVGAQPHFIGWVLLPDGTTEEQIGVVLDEEMQAEMSGTPPVYSDIDPEEDIMPVTFTGTQSADTSIWIEVDLEAGTHGLVCFFPDVSDGTPHAYYGMYTVIEVGE